MDTTAMHVTLQKHGSGYSALKRLLNHSDGNDVTGGYLQITTDRLREPMERISTKLLELMKPAIAVNVQQDGH